MRIRFEFAHDLVDGQTIHAAVEHVANFLDLSLMGSALVHPLDTILVHTSCSGHFAVNLKDDNGEWAYEQFYKEGDFWCNLNDHPMVKAGILKVADNG